MSEDPPIDENIHTAGLEVATQQGQVGEVGPGTADVIGASMMAGSGPGYQAEAAGENGPPISLSLWEGLVHTDPVQAEKLAPQVFSADSLPFAKVMVNALAAEATDFTTLPTYKIMKNRLNRLFGGVGSAPPDAQIVLPEVPYEPIFGTNNPDESLPPLERIEPEARQAQANVSEGGVLAGPTSMTVLFIDLAKFKRLNDEHGHAKGDELLTAVGRRLGRAFRYAGHTLGESPSDTVAHRSGDEFVATIFGVDSSASEALVKRVADHLKEVSIASGVPVSEEEAAIVSRASVAGAYAEKVASYEDAMALIKAADDTLNEQKRPERAADPRV